jgi:tetratricopeptide (TPR) repeat protein
MVRCLSGKWSTGMSARFRYGLRSLAVLTVVGHYAATAMAGPIEDCNTLRAAAALEPCTLVVDDKQQTPAKRAVALLMRARAALDMSNLDRAEADIKAAFALQPATPFGYRIRGRLLGLQGKNTEARADYAKAIQLSESQAGKYVSYQDRGNFLLRIMELPAAQADFEAAIRLDPAKAAGYVGRALTNKAMGKIGEALADLDRAKAVEPSYLLTHVERGDILLAEKRFADAIAAYDLALAIRANDARAVRGRAAASALVTASNVPAPPPAPATTSPTPPPSVAAPAAPTPAAPSPTPPAPPAAAPQPPAPSVAAPAAPTPAAPSPTPPAQPAAAPQPPTVTPPPAQSGDAVDAAAKQAEERRRQLREAFELRQKGKPLEAIVIYDALLRQAPADAEAAIEKGRTLISLSKWKEALDTFKLVLDSKTAPVGMKALALEGQGEVFARNNVYPAAIQSTTMALQLNPKLHGALFWRGISSYSLGAFDKALADFQQATSIVPKSPVYPGWEAIALVSAGDLPKAKEAIDRAFTIQPDNVNALTARARLRLATGEIVAAEADLAQLVRRGPLNPVALETQQLIMIHKVMKPSDQPSPEARR